MEINGEVFKPFGLSRKTNITLVAMLIVLWLVQAFFKLLETLGAAINDVKFFTLLLFAAGVIGAILVFAKKGRDLQYQLDVKEAGKDTEKH